MYMHIVMLELSATCDAQFFDTVNAYAQRIRHECQGVRLYQFTANEASRSQGYSHAVISAFDSAALHDAYQTSQAHQAMKAYMAPFIERLAVFDGMV
ncbi:Dabb family protein [Vandammella animalimorsus]|uniref:Dabb family protein n=1 Tax=Vandammella animalimorsus TaxID=2029117 RepID=A0A3M6R4N8_9BURK|nr:Dabb family protein [Vandammella animalimorsus]RMX10039.1 Dabb family protein [Vandammella animalimorsus]